MVNVVRESVADVDCVLLMVEPVAAAGPQEEALIQRIRGRNGHLSNDQGAELLAAVAGSGLRHVVPMHLSGECNEPALAVAAARDALRAAGLDPGLVRRPAFPTPLLEI